MSTTLLHHQSPMGTGTNLPRIYCTTLEILLETYFKAENCRCKYCTVYRYYLALNVYLNLICEYESESKPYKLIC